MLFPRLEFGFDEFSPVFGCQRRIISREALSGE